MFLDVRAEQTEIDYIAKSHQTLSTLEFLWNNYRNTWRIHLEDQEYEEYLWHHILQSTFMQDDN